MLKITTTNNEGQQKLVLEGKLIEPWIAEFKKAWQEAKQTSNGHKLVIDLGDVTVISAQAECVLLEVKREGAEFHCAGILTKHMVRQIERRCKQQ